MLIIRVFIAAVFCMALLLPEASFAASAAKAPQAIKPANPCDAKLNQPQPEGEKKEYSKDAPWYPHLIGGLTNFSMGKLPQAETEAKEALRISKETNDPEPQQELLRLLGTIYSEEKRFDLAIPALEAALTLERKKAEPNKLALMNTLLNLGQAYESNQQHEKAIPLLREAKTFITPCSPFYYNLMVSLGKAYLGADRLAEAEPALKETLKIAQANKNEEHTLDNLCDLAVLYIKQKQFAKALQMAEAAAPLNTRLRDPNSQETVIFNKNLQHLRDAVKAQKSSDNVKRWLALMEAGKNNMIAKKYALASTNYEKALKIADIEDAQSPQAALNRALLATTYTYTGKLKESEVLYAKALPVLRKNPTVIGPGNLANYEKMYQALKIRNKAITH